LGHFFGAKFPPFETKKGGGGGGGGEMNLTHTLFWKK